MSQYHAASHLPVRLLPHRRLPYATRPHSGLGDFSFKLPLMRLALAVVTVIVIVGLLAIVTAAQAGLSRGESEQAAASDGARSSLPSLPSGMAAAALPISTTTTVTATAEASPTVALPTATTTVALTATSTLSLTAMLDDAWKVEDWPQVIKIIDAMLAAARTDTALAEKSFAAHFNAGMQLARTDHPADAVAEFDKALTSKPGDGRVLEQRKPALLYAEALADLDKGDLPAAIKVLQTIV